MKYSFFFFFFSSRRRHTRFKCDWSSDVCSSDLYALYARASADDEMLLSVAAHQLALSLENAVGYERERSRRRELEDRDRRKDEFLAVLAHELRTPLAAIVAAMALIAEPATDPEVTRTARAVVTRQVRHQAGLLDDLLDLTRVAHGRLGLR